MNTVTKSGFSDPSNAGIVGWLAGHALTVIFSPMLSAETGVLLNRWAFSPAELILFPILLALGALVGFLPAMAAYRTNVAEALQS